MSKPKAILFDLGNVLFEIDIPKCSKNIYALLDEKTDTDEFRDRFREKNEALERGELSKAAFVNFILSQARQGVQALDVILAWNSMLIGMPEEHFDMIKRLRKRYKLYVLSNINAFHHPRFHEMIAENHGITEFDDYFDRCFYSHLIGFRKPDIEVFDHVLKRIEEPSKDVLYLDDSEGHLKSASKLGIQTQHIPDIRKTREIGEWLLM